MKKIILSSLIICLLLSCYDEQEGCQDSAATNFDVFADRACDDCCSYPTLAVRLEPFWGAEFLDNDSLYLLQGDSIKFLDISFLASDFTLTGIENSIEVEDILTLSLDDGSEISLKDDIIYVNNSQFSYPLGTTQESGSAIELSFSIGIPEDLDAISPELFPEDNAIFVNSDTLYSPSDLAYSKVMLLFAHHHTSIDTILYSFKTNALNDVSIPLDTVFATGTNITVNVAMNYQELIQNVDLIDDTEELIESEIIKNISEIFSVQ